VARAVEATTLAQDFALCLSRHLHVSRLGDAHSHYSNERNIPITTIAAKAMPMAICHIVFLRSARSASCSNLSVAGWLSKIKTRRIGWRLASMRIGGETTAKNFFRRETRSAERSGRRVQRVGGLWLKPLLNRGVRISLSYFFATSGEGELT
jgi:hypothetical protein